MNPYIYSVIPEATLKDILTSFSVCTGIPTKAVDADGTVVAEIGEHTGFCDCVEKYVCKDVPGSCRQVRINAGKRASELGESYIFSCPANLINIVFPLMNKNSLFGTVFVGPFIMDDPDSLLLLDIAKKNNVGPEEFLKMYNGIGEVKIIPPSTVTQLARLLYYLLSAAVADNRQRLLINKGKLYQQSKISESIQKYKEFGAGDTEFVSYPYEKEKELIARVKVGDTQGANAILNELLGYTLFAEGNDLSNIRPRALELASLLSRAAIEGGASANNILRINNDFLQHLQEDITIDDICYHLQEITEVFTESMFGDRKPKNTETIKKAIQYITQHYSSELTLEEVARHVGLNPSYFSSYFKQICGSSFKEYLNMVRVEEAKRLLTNTDYTILDIAVAVGFDNQSYFSKVFRKFTGLTPKQFR